MTSTPGTHRAATGLLTVLGAVVAVLGVAAAVASLAGDGGAVLLVVGVLAVLVGGFVLLVGQGARRQLAARDLVAAERALDDRIMAAQAAATAPPAAAQDASCTHDPSGCGSCGAACALAGRRSD